MYFVFFAMYIRNRRLSIMQSPERMSALYPHVAEPVTRLPMVFVENVR